MATNELKSVRDIKLQALERAGELIDGTSEFDTLCVDAIDKWHKGVLAGSTELEPDLGDPWPWGRAQYPGVINLEIPVEGTLSINKDATTGTFGAAPAVSMVGWLFRLSDSGKEMYRITTHVAGQAAFTISGAFTEDSVTAGAYKAYKMEYSLTNVLRLISPMRVFQSPQRIEGIDPTTMDKDYPMSSLRCGLPDKFAVAYQTDSTYRIRFNKTMLTGRARVEYEYIPVPTTLQDATDVYPLIPVEHRAILMYAGAYEVLKLKNDDRVNEYRLLLQASLQALARAFRRTKGQSNPSFGRIIPRPDLLGRVSRSEE